MRESNDTKRLLSEMKTVRKVYDGLFGAGESSKLCESVYLDMPGSFEYLRDKLQTLVNAMFPSPKKNDYYYVNICATYADSIVVRVDFRAKKDTYYSIPYTVSDTGDPVLGSKKEISLGVVLVAK